VFGAVQCCANSALLDSFWHMHSLQYLIASGKCCAECMACSMDGSMGCVIVFSKCCACFWVVHARRAFACTGCQLQLVRRTAGCQQAHARLAWVDGFEAGCYVQRVVHPLCLEAKDMMDMVSISRHAGACTGWQYHKCSCCQFQAASAACGVMIVTKMRVPGSPGMAVHVCDLELSDRLRQKPSRLCDPGALVARMQVLESRVRMQQLVCLHWCVDVLDGMLCVTRCICV